MNQHFKKRKARSSSAPVSPRRAACSATSTTSSTMTGSGSPMGNNFNAPLMVTTPSASSPSALTAVSMEGVNLSAALTALKVSLKREMESFIPPTPVASPIHARSAKRPRFDFGVVLPDPSEISNSNLTKASPAPCKLLRGGVAFLSVSHKLQQELERRARPDSSDHTLRARKRRQQLSYFAIASAFHRAAHERERPLVTVQSVE